MFFNILNIIKDMLFATGSYSNNVFPDPLTSEEEAKCIELMMEGDKDARNKLIEHNLRLVAHIVKKYDSKDADTDDLISIGTIGLIKGIDSYKSSKATKITTYAARCIENEVLMHFRSNAARCVQNEILMHYRTNKKSGPTISLNDSVGFDKEGNEISLIDLIKDQDIDFCDKLQIKDNIEQLSHYLKKLNDREKEIIIKRYGLFNQKEQTQKEIAKELSISRSYVSRIEKRALTKMLREFISHKNIN